MPITRFRNYLESLDLWSEQQEQESNKLIRKSILSAFTHAGKESKPAWKELFTDVYYTMPEHIRYVCRFSVM